MDCVQNEKKAKATNQDWRKRPRRFAPKSRLGCKTCKIRRVKCDLTRPSCLKCKSTGRTCDGYTESLHGGETVIESSHPCKVNIDALTAEDRVSYQACTAMIASHPGARQWRTRSYHFLDLHRLRPIMIDSEHAEPIHFFEYCSLKHLNTYQPWNRSWQKTLMFFCQTVPSVRSAAIALALLHRERFDGKSATSKMARQAPLFYYTRAIQLLLNQDLHGNDDPKRTAITLLVCYLFTCFDHLVGNDLQAMKHLRGGVEISRNIDKTFQDNSNINNNDDSSREGTPNISEIRKLIYQVTSQIHRLDTQTVMFLLDWTPMDIDTMPGYQLRPCDTAFQSLDQATIYLQTVISKVIRLRHTEQQMYPTHETPPPPSLWSQRTMLLGQLKTWCSLFEAMLQQQYGPCSYNDTDPCITLLRLQHTIAWIFLNGYGPGREMEYDAFLIQFQQCVAWAGAVAAAHEQYVGSLEPTFTPEIGILPALYIIGSKCRHPQVRREVLGILRRQRIQEAVWDSIHTAVLLERVIEIEESGGTPAGAVTQIPAWQRIEALSWHRVTSGDSVPRLDITYTFCMREGVYVESLPI
ncbi:hypothetical protein L228DRAFT_251439 [Xylona heveae TC161]|uniref:Zn(2)-C6 fungal-type domain-containing protein n=1 Tax=Xylona heveae (strain CBS 132557 / TC161) TaxID=1328760 RepID=A0A164ZC43_XYLHT|nr:hypothetical protein L228DRAFT_251439 [Xylona heveae TC161]KZF18919.1 hypothetical protein L228DRAFT_251439 [Xylona heveae TC161]